MNKKEEYKLLRREFDAMIKESALAKTENLSRVIFLREVLATAAVKDAVHESQYHAGVMQGVALALASADLGTTDSIVYQARERARNLIQSGQDWRREIDLYDNLVRRFG